MARGDEFIGHGRTNAERQDILWEEDERRLIVESRDAILRHTGKAPEGWMGPYIAQTPVTLDLLKQEGFRYVMDWPADDQPFWMRTSDGPILSVPYSVEINDSPVMAFPPPKRHRFRGDDHRPVRRTAGAIGAKYPAGVQHRPAPLRHRATVPPASVSAGRCSHVYERIASKLWLTRPGEIWRGMWRRWRRASSVRGSRRGLGNGVAKPG